MSGLKRNYTVKKQIAGGQKVYRKWSEYETGDVVVGKYIGTHKDQYDKVNMVLLVEDAYFKDGTGEDMVGKNLVINSCGTLDKAMEELAEGAMVQIEYTGTVKLEKGPYKGKEAHTMSIVEVEADSEDMDL